MAIAPRRNAACPCGSEKKFKKCCQGKLTTWQEQYYALLQAQSAIKNKLLHVLRESVGADTVNEMIAEFTGGEPLDENNLPSFFDWLWFEATNREESRGWLPRLVKDHERAFTPEELLILRDWIQYTQAGVFEIVQANPKEWGSTLREVISEKEYVVRDRKLSDLAIKGDLLLIRVQKILGEYYCSGSGRRYDRFMYLERLKSMITESYRTEKEKDSKLSYEEFMNSNARAFFDLELPSPVILAHDGAKAKVCTRRYAIRAESAKSILDWLSAREDVVLTDVETEKTKICYAHASFVFKEVKTPRRRGDTGRNVVGGIYLMSPDGGQQPCIGDITIEDDRLTLRSLSTKAFREIAQKLDVELQHFVTLEDETIKDMKEALEDEEPDEDEEDILTDVPKKIMEEYYKKWCTIRIPALGNKTPKQAMKSEKGRKQLKTLLISMENYEQHKAREQGNYIPVEKIVRKELGFYDE